MGTTTNSGRNQDKMHREIIPFGSLKEHIKNYKVGHGKEVEA